MGICPSTSKENPDEKTYKPENLDCLFLEKLDSFFSAASVHHRLCHEMMLMLRKVRGFVYMNEISTNVTMPMCKSLRDLLNQAEQGLHRGSLIQ